MPTELQITQIARDPGGDTALHCLQAGPATNAAGILLPALAWLAGPLLPYDPEVDPTAVHGVPLPPPTAVPYELADTEWTRRTRQAVNHEPDGVDWLVDSIGGMPAVRDAFGEGFDIDLADFQDWQHVSCTTEEIARAHSVLEYLAEDGVRTARAALALAHRSTRSVTTRFAQTWEEASGQSADCMACVSDSGISDDHDYVFAHLVINAPASGVAVTARTDLTSDLRRYIEQDDPAQIHAGVFDDLLPGLIEPGLRTAVREIDAAAHLSSPTAALPGRPDLLQHTL